MPRAYWTIEAEAAAKAGLAFKAALSRLDGTEIDDAGLASGRTAEDAAKRIRESAFTVASVERDTLRRPPTPPFTTSALQQEAALAYLRAGDALVVWKLDRLARSLSQLIRTIDDLRAADIGFHSLTEQLDTTTPAGRALFQISGAFAEFERSIIQERTRAGLEAARAADKILGRPSKLDPAKLKAARAMLRDPDLTIREIAEQLGVSRSTLYRHFPAARSPAR